MKSYRVYWMDTRHRIQRAEWIDAADDEDAKHKASELCDEHSVAIEVWQGLRRVDEVPCEHAA